MDSSPPPKSLNAFESVINAIYCKLILMLAPVGAGGVKMGGLVSGMMGPLLAGLSSLNQIGKMQLGGIVAVILMIMIIIAISLTAGTFSKVFGTVLIVIFACIIAIPLIYNLILRKQLGEGVAAANAGNTGQIFIMVLFVIAFIVYMYLDPLAKLTDYVSGYSIFLILAAFVCLFALSYNKYVFNQYAGALIVFIAFAGLIYFWNPFAFLTSHIGISSITLISLASAIIISMLMYQNNKFFAAATANSSMSGQAQTPSLLSTDAVNTLNHFMGVIVFIMAIYGLITLEQSYASNSSVVSWGLLFAIIFTMAAITYKFIDKSSFLDRFPIVRLIINVILYIPCIYVSKIENLLNLFGAGKEDVSKTPRSVWVLLASELVLIGAYIAFPYLHKYYQRKVYIGGTNQGLLLINEPKDCSSENTVSSYSELNEPDESSEAVKTVYNYALSMWFNIDALPPSTGAQYNKFTSLFNYGEKPNIKYRADTNTYMITTETDKDNTRIKQVIQGLKTEKGYDDDQIAQYFKEIGLELDEDDNRIVYKSTSIPMQKWNNLVLNYSGGTLDIFVNGVLAQSAIEVAPYIVNDTMTTGTTNGISGAICGLIYFKHTLNISDIRSMYEQFKQENPPTFLHDVSINVKKK